jgi:hypothetical protein
MADMICGPGHHRDREREDFEAHAMRNVAAIPSRCLILARIVH